MHNDFVLATMRPAIGVAREYVAKLEQYEPHGSSLMSVHQGYIESWRAHEFAMVSIIDAVERQDYIQLSRANEELLEAQRAVSDSLAALARLPARSRPCSRRTYWSTDPTAQPRV